VADKLRAHEPPGLLHLAFSVFIFDSAGQLLLQRRADSKYHFPGVWANACCSHPEPGEDLEASAERRLREELGLQLPEGAKLVEAGAFVYRATDPKTGLIEHEYDRVLVGIGLDAEPQPDPAEVAEYRWVDPAEVMGAGATRGFAPWFAEALELALSLGGQLNCQ
jgi:isopentenyl-diphosphate delta-isomerase